MLPEKPDGLKFGRQPLERKTHAESLTRGGRVEEEAEEEFIQNSTRARRDYQRDGTNPLSRNDGLEGEEGEWEEEEEEFI